MTAGGQSERTDNGGEAIRIRPADVTDAVAAHDIVMTSGALEPNSGYAYALAFREFGDTCRVAIRDGAVVGFVLGFVPPTRTDTVFVWQIGVREDARGIGVGHALLEALTSDRAEPFAYLEATVAPSNTTSRALFTGFAKRRGAPLVTTPCFDSNHFPGSTHESEPLLRIGPLRGATT